MPVYELINPSDRYTFVAPNIEVAGACACLLSTGFGAKDVSGTERTPVLWGWQEWLDERGIDGDWIDAHANELADAWDSFLIGSFSDRQDVEDMLAMIPVDKQDEWKAKRQDRHRTSMNQIGEAAYRYVKAYRKHTTPTPTEAGK